jgi:SAM-dependent methyltransferase
VARARLEPLGVRVVRVDSEPDLPFSDAMFDLVLNRHGDYRPSELRRILRTGGRFFTQQVGGQNNIELNALLQERVEFMYSYWTLDLALRELRDAGFEIVESYDEHPETIVMDIGAVVFMLRIISWQISDFSVEKYRHKLMALHNRIQETGPLVIHSHRFCIEATR